MDKIYERVRDLAENGLRYMFAGPGFDYPEVPDHSLEFSPGEQSHITGQLRPDIILKAAMLLWENEPSIAAERTTRRKTSNTSCSPMGRIETIAMGDGSRPKEIREASNPRKRRLSEDTASQPRAKAQKIVQSPPAGPEPPKELPNGHSYSMSAPQVGASYTEPPKTPTKIHPRRLTKALGARPSFQGAREPSSSPIGYLCVNEAAIPQSVPLEDPFGIKDKGNDTQETASARGMAQEKQTYEHGHEEAGVDARPPLLTLGASLYVLTSFFSRRSPHPSLIPHIPTISLVCQSLRIRTLKLVGWDWAI